MTVLFDSKIRNLNYFSIFLHNKTELMQNFNLKNTLDTNLHKINGEEINGFTVLIIDDQVSLIMSELIFFFIRIKNLLQNQIIDKKINIMIREQGNNKLFNLLNDIQTSYICKLERYT